MASTTSPSAGAAGQLVETVGSGWQASAAQADALAGPLSRALPTTDLVALGEAGVAAGVALFRRPAPLTAAAAALLVAGWLRLGPGGSTSGAALGTSAPSRAERACARPVTSPGWWRNDPVLTDDWWATSEGLVEVAEAAAGAELAPKARLALVEMTVELLVLLTCWPGTARPADALGYLRTRRARMVAHAPWLYALPPSVRRLLLGTHCLPSVLTFVIGGRQIDEALCRAWRRALGVLASHVEAADRPAPVGWDHDGRAREVQDMRLAPLAWASAVALPAGALPGIGVMVGSLEGPVPPVGASQLPFATQPCAPAG